MPVHKNHGMPRRKVRHTVTDDDLLAYLRREDWVTFASSSDEPKTLEVMSRGIGFRVGFRVTIRGVQVYRGQNASDAVRAYNEE